MSLIQALHGLPPRLLVAVSGGSDSVGLLHALATTSRDLLVVHFNHGWRAESAADAHWVRRYGRSLGLRVVVGRPPPGGARTEAAARAARYEFFARVAKRERTFDLVLAHHADDSVETFLLQLLRGTGAGGQGLQARRERAGLILHRPWLGFRRTELVAYVAAHRLEWREDATNAETRLRRNFLRHEILPRLREVFGSAIDANLARAAELAQTESAWLDELCRVESNQPELSVADLRAFPVARQRRTILRWLQRHEIGDLRLSVVEAVRRLLEPGSAPKINLAEGRHVRRRAGKIFLEPAPAPAARQS